jgi:hypothetical protein
MQHHANVFAEANSALRVPCALSHITLDMPTIGRAAVRQRTIDYRFENSSLTYSNTTFRTCYTRILLRAFFVVFPANVFSRHGCTRYSKPLGMHFGKCWVYLLGIATQIEALLRSERLIHTPPGSTKKLRPATSMRVGRYVV